jgi:ferritin-like metal-binding protein YciE
MAIIYRTLIAANSKAGKSAVASQCAQKLARVLDTQDQLRRIVQAKLALDTLFLHI